jgi:hypothetical protein
MSYLNNMYGAARGIPANNNKNPNRVAGGLRGQGADHYVMLGEDGSEQKIPSQKYVKALEEKIRMQDSKISVLEKKIKGVTNELHNISSNQRMASRESQRANIT